MAFRANIIVQKIAKYQPFQTFFIGQITETATFRQVSYIVRSLVLGKFSKDSACRMCFTWEHTGCRREGYFARYWTPSWTPSPTSPLRGWGAPMRRSSPSRSSCSSSSGGLAWLVRSFRSSENSGMTFKTCQPLGASLRNINMTKKTLFKRWGILLDRFVRTLLYCGMSLQNLLFVIMFS